MRELKDMLFNSLLRSPEVKVQRRSCRVPATRIAVITVLSSVVCVEHPDVLVRPLDTTRIPFLIPGMTRPVIKDLDRTVRNEMEAVNEQVTFSGEHVSIGRGVSTVYPAEFDPVPVP